MNSGIKVIAINVNTGGADGLDATGQATAIAAATGGVFIPSADPDAVSDEILAGLTAVPISVSMASTCAYPISTSFDPLKSVVPSGSAVSFKETISVDANAKPGTYTCRDYATIDGVPMTDVAGAVIYETKTITVPDPQIIKIPDLANLWLCQPVATCANPAAGIGERDFNIYLRDPVTSNSPKGEEQTIGSFSFEVRFDRKLVNVDVVAGPLLTEADVNLG
ncbi:MAG: hypothetical protein ACRDU4_22660, partial [Mycobacterium sp.]